MRNREKHSLLTKSIEQSTLNRRLGIKGIQLYGTAKRFIIQYICYAILSLFTITTCFFSLLDAATGILTAATIARCILFTGMLCAFGAKLLQENSCCSSKSFLIIGLPALLMFSWFMLPDQVPDEIWHIYRALNIGWCGGPTLDVPDLLTYQQTPTNYLTYRYALQVRDAWSHMHIVDRTLSGYYSHLYLFSGLLAELGKWLNLNPLIVVWMARLGNVCAYLIAGYFTLRIIPIGRTTAFLYLLNPMLLELEASCSADAVLNMVSNLFIAVFLRVLLNPEPSKADFISLGCLYVLTSLSKQAYVLLGGLFLAFVWKHQIRRRIKAFLAAGIVLSLLCVCALILVYPWGVDSELGYAIDLVRQPRLFCSVMIKTIWERLPFWISSFAGGTLGAFTVSTWEPCFWGYLIVIAISIFYNEGDACQLLKQQKLYLTLLSLFLILVLTLPFRAWSIKVDGRSDIIQGVQGRYYLPFMLLPLIGLISPSGQVVRKNCYFRFGIFMAVDLFVVLISIVLTFY